MANFNEIKAYIAGIITAGSYGTFYSTNAREFANLTQKTNTSNFSLTMSFSRRTGIRLPLPILKDMKLDNNINFSLSFDKGSSENLSNTGGGSAFTTIAKSDTWKLSPQINYSFSSKVTGGVYFEIGKNKSIRGSNDYRDFGLNVNIAIRG